MDATLPVAENSRAGTDSPLYDLRPSWDISPTSPLFDLDSPESRRLVL